MEIADCVRPSGLGEAMALCDQHEGTQQVGVQGVGQRHFIGLIHQTYQGNSFC
jgi:hypothetical protein